MGAHKSKEPGLKLRPPIPQRPKFDTKLLVAGLALVAVIGYGMAKKLKDDNRTTEPTGQNQVSDEQALLNLPPSTLSIRPQPLPNRDLRFNEVTTILESFLTFDPSSECSYKIGRYDQVNAFLLSLKERLESRGFDFTRESLTPRQILESVHGYHRENNVWLFLKRAVLTQATGEQEHVVCLFRNQIERRASLSYSYFNGRISDSNIPIYYLSGPQRYVRIETLAGTVASIGITFRPGIAIWLSTIRDDSIDPVKGMEDLVRHEGIHFHTNRSDSFVLDHIVPYIREGRDLNSAARINGRIMPLDSDQRDEARAYLIQMMYGHYPFAALRSVLGANTERQLQYSFAQRVLDRAVGRYLSENNPRQHSRYVSYGILDSNTISDDQLRRIAYRTFIDEGL